MKARKVQNERYKQYDTVNYNSELDSRLIKKYCKINDEEKEYLRKIYKVKRLSARTFNKLLKVARTIADLDESENIQKKHLVEASNYRGIEDRWLK
ncbi:MAG: hypothetical protein MJ151_02275 [Lachnospiraceae bacterium]|nr:hypothetical protein [Lachnospiraceae bacterium]